MSSGSRPGRLAALIALDRGWLRRTRPSPRPGMCPPGAGQGLDGSLQAGRPSPARPPRAHFESGARVPAAGGGRNPRRLLPSPCPRLPGVALGRGGAAGRWGLGIRCGLGLAGKGPKPHPGFQTPSWAAGPFPACGPTQPGCCSGSARI